MKQTHTPGPWHVKNGSSIYASNRYIGLALSGHLYGNDLPQEANARLMAAAPELLEALKELSQHTRKVNGIYSPEYNKAIRLIKKIEGDESNT